MNKVKTAELTGVRLDWAVAKCEGYKIGLFLVDNTQGSKNISKYVAVKNFSYEDSWPFHPSIDWGHGGPIIDRENITLVHRGPTPLIAAMRCYVSSKFGDEIEIPKELFL